MDLLQPEFNTAPLAESSLGSRRTQEQRESLKLRPQSQAKRYDIGGEMLSVPEMAEKYGLQIVTIRARLRKGLTGLDLVVAPRDSAMTKVQINGQWLTLQEVADRAGLPLTTIYSRVRAGDVGDALLRPREHCGRNSLR